MPHPNNKGKGTYNAQRRAYAHTEERLAYSRAYAKRKYHENRELALIKLRERRAANPKANRWSYYRSNARKRNIAFELDRASFEDLIKQDCVYCGEVAKPLNGVDRKDNAQGYTTWNSVACCEICNHMKYVLSPDAFVQKCIQVAEKHKL